MFTIKVKTKEQREIDNLQSENIHLKNELKKNKSYIDYIAMMTDVDIPTQENE